MATISGTVFFSTTRVVNSGTGIPNVPVILRDTATGLGLVVLTSATGTFSFTNVPNGNYTLVEGWGTAGGVATPGDFTTAVVIPAPTPTDPPVSQVTAPPSGTNIIDSISPNTLNLNVSGNLANQNFTDAPRQDIPFVVNDITLIGSNLLTSANNGDWGTLPAGSPVNSIPGTAPYPGVVPDFTYTTGTPNASQYTVDNISNGLLAPWWNMANHTTGDETGRFEVINGAPVGYRFFSETISVKPNTTYLFDSWFANMVKTAGYPAGPGVRITTPSGTVVFSTAATNIPSNTSLLQWYEIGSFFNSGNNTSLILNFIDVNGGASGNDYAADDFSLTEAQINNILAPATKTVDKTSASLGDTLTYTIAFSNHGISTAQNIQFIDTIPSGTTFINNSLTINGVATAFNPSPPNGVAIANMGSGAATTIVFKVLVNTVPTVNPIPNSAVINYSFAPVVGSTNTIPTAVSSNIVYTSLNTLSSINKTVDKNYGTLGDTLTYNINFNNIGAESLTNITFIDTIPTGTTFITNSLLINGVAQPGLNPNPPGITIPDIPSGQGATVTFSVLVTTIPATNPIKNQGVLNYTFTSSTTPISSISNQVATTINYASLTSGKIVSATNAFVGDILTYTVTIANSGNTTANNVLFIDTIPNETTFVLNSFAINGVVQPGVSPAPPGITLPDIGSNKITTLTFSVTVDTIPTPNPTTNISTTGYTFTTATSTVVNSATNNSNMVGTFVNNYSNPLKIVNAQYGSIGDTLTYTIRYINDSPITLTSVTFFDTIPNGTTFVPGSITVNGVSTPGTVAPPTGITLPDIAPNAIGTVVFQVAVNTLPTPNPIPNTGFFEFTPLGTTTVASVYSNTVTTEINKAIISPISKTVDQVFAGLGDVLTYTINLYNSGNVTALNVVVSDTMPNGTTFITNSLTLNSVTQSGSTIAPPSGFTVGTIPVGQTATVAFKVTVVSIPTPNPTPNTATTTYDYVLYSATGTLGSGSNNTNTVNTTINAAEVTAPVKAVNTAYTAIPATLTYTITMKNTGNVTALNLVFSDTIPTDTTLVPNSVTLNGVTQSGAVVAPPGFTVGTLAAGSIATVTFQVTVTTIPTSNPILNSGTTNYSYLITPVLGTTGTGNGNTNIVSTTVNYADLSGSSKSVNSAYGTCGDILTYMITIPNSGNVSAFNVFIKDTIPSGTVLVPNSLIVNGVTAVGGDPSVGVTIPSIAVGAAATLSFMVQVQC